MSSPEASLGVGVFGLGRMGSALANALLEKSFKLTVWNRTRDKSARFAGSGASVAASPEAAAKASGLLVICLSDYAAIQNAFMTREVGDAIRGKTVVSLCSASSSEIKDLSQWIGRKGADFLSGTILVYPDDIRLGKGTVLYGGPRKVFDANYPALEAMGGRPVLASEDIEAADWIGGAYGHVLFSTLFGFINGAAMCHRFGISPVFLWQKIIEPTLRDAPIPGMIERLASASAIRKYDGDVQASLNVWNGSLSTMVADMRTYGFDADVLHAVKCSLDRAVEQGFGEMDLASVFEVLIADKRKAELAR
jgi:3-hydroxyisobutyrate dehydrogenase-like beta-hydroxyacid dehydrogenase